MEKIAQYLNANIAGGVITSDWVRNYYSRDKSPLKILPSAVTFPQDTIDIRKIVKLINQLAEKGKTVPITVRGNGTDLTGGAIGDGLLIDMSRNLNQIIDFDPSQGLIHAQAGINVDSLAKASTVYNLNLPILNSNNQNTLGGFLAIEPINQLPGGIKDIPMLVDQLEVIISNGDTIQTRKLTKRELDKKMGLANFEGEIYRKLDKLIEDNAALISKIDTSIVDHAGYPNIAKVKSANGSFNLTPLLIGSQGTLGIITEAIIKLTESPDSQALEVMYFKTIDDALDAIDDLKKLSLKSLEYYDARFFETARKLGKTFDSYDKATKFFNAKPAICLISGHHTKKSRSLLKDAKKIEEIAVKHKGMIVLSSKDNMKLLGSIRLMPNAFADDSNGTDNVPVIRGIMIPTYKFSEFSKKITEIEKSIGVKLEFWGSALHSTFNARTMLDLNQVSDKQKMFRLLDAISKLTDSLGGTLCSATGEGRLKTYFARRGGSQELNKLYSEIKKIFDPNDIFNSGVKSSNTVLKDVILQTTNNYSDGVKF